MIAQETYPHVPGHKVHGPSLAAARATEPVAGRLRQQVKEALACGPLTADECAAELGESILSIRPRFSELLALGEIEDAGDRRRNSSGRKATVWRLAVNRSQPELFIL